MKTPIQGKQPGTQNDIDKIMSEIEQIQTNKMIQIPSRIEAKYLKDYAQLDLRFELSKLTYIYLSIIL